MKFEKRLNYILDRLNNEHIYLVIIKTTTDDIWKRVYRRINICYQKDNMKNKIGRDLWEYVCNGYKRSKSDSYVYSLIIIYYLSILEEHIYMYVIDKDKFYASLSDNSQVTYLLQ